MIRAPVERLASALLYEGYLLYPYRRSSVKNRQRFNFGVLLPETCADTEGGSERSFMQTECLVEDADRAALTVTIRFLHLVERHQDTEAGGDQWLEAIEREVVGAPQSLESLMATPRTHRFEFPGGQETDAAGVVRRRRTLRGGLSLTATRLEPGLCRIRTLVTNRTGRAPSGITSREAALPLSLVSAHTILTVSDGAFVSLLEPPDRLARAAAGCRNIGTWPVLVGEAGHRDLMLSSPITLYDYPVIAPESSGDLFDATEIDEILHLRILTLSEAEKEEMRQGDERARLLLERTESLGAEQMMALHGTMRDVRQLRTEGP